MLCALLAWSFGVACVFVMARRLRQLSRLELPDDRALSGLLGRRAQSGAKAALLGELDDQLLDVDALTRARPEFAAALARAALAAGTALSLVALSAQLSLRALPSALGCFSAGVVSAFAVAQLGRLANARARAAREHWAALARRVRARLETLDETASL